MKKLERQCYSLVLSLDDAESKEICTTNNFDEAESVSRKIVGTHVRRGENEYSAVIGTERSVYIAPSTDIEELP